MKGLGSESVAVLGTTVGDAVWGDSTVRGVHWYLTVKRRRHHAWETAG